jgi:hypothetical protein
VCAAAAIFAGGAYAVLAIERRFGLRRLLSCVVVGACVCHALTIIMTPCCFVFVVGEERYESIVASGHGIAADGRAGDDVVRELHAAE